MADAWVRLLLEEKLSPQATDEVERLLFPPTLRLIPDKIQKPIPRYKAA